MRALSTYTRVSALAMAVVLIAGVMTASPALARAGCSSGPHQGEADITVQQIISAINGSTDLSDDVRLTNLGPCNVPAASLFVTLPAGALYVGYSSNPSAWTCTPATNPPTAPSGPISCSEQNTIGVPGTADIFIRFNIGTGSGSPVIACGSGGPDTPLCPTAAPGTPPDGFPGNNLSYAGVVGAGGSVTYGPNGDPVPLGLFKHTTSVTLSNGGLVNIYQASGCPASVPTCFPDFGTVTVSTTASGSKIWTLSLLASVAGKKSLSQITIWNSFTYNAADPTSLGASFTALTSCNSKQATDPCVLDRSRSTNSLGETYYTITIQGTHDDGMTAD